MTEIPRCNKCGRWKNNKHKCPKRNPMYGTHRLGEKSPFYWKVIQAAALACWLLVGIVMMIIAIGYEPFENMKQLALVFAVTSGSIALNYIVMEITRIRYKEVNNK